MLHQDVIYAKMHIYKLMETYIQHFIPIYSIVNCPDSHLRNNAQMRLS